MQQQQPSITAPQTPQTPQRPLERELPMLAGIGAFVTWCEDLLAVLSGPILTAGLAIALIDLLSDGQLFTRLPMLLWVWAGSMALGLDAQFIGSSAKLARAMRQRRPWVATGYILLCLALGYVAFLATYVFAVQEANGITTTAALSRLGMDSTTWIFQRSVLAVILVFLSGLLRYVPPAINVAADTTEERERLLAEIELEPLRAQKRAMQLRGMRGAVLAGLGREQPASPQPTLKPRIYAASATMQEPIPEEHIGSAAATYKAMHDIDWVDLPDEVEGDEDPNMTTFIPSISRPLDPRTSGAYDDTGARDMSPPNASYMSDDFDLFDDDDEYPSGSAHQRKQQKTAKGRRTQRKRTHQLEMKTQSDRERQRAIKQAVWAVAQKAEADGIQYTEDARAAAVNDYLKQQGSEVRTSRTAVRSWMRGWYNQRRHQQRTPEIGPMEPQELRELVATEAW